MITAGTCTGTTQQTNTPRAPVIFPPQKPSQIGAREKSRQERRGRRFRPRAASMPKCQLDVSYTSIMMLMYKTYYQCKAALNPSC